MKKNVFYFLSAFLLIFAAGCSDMADVEPTVDQDALTESIETNALGQDGQNLRKDRTQKIEGKGLKNLKVSGDIGDEGAFTGMVTITSFDYDEVNGLTASGEIKGIASSSGKKISVKEAFSNVPVVLSDTDLTNARVNATAETECPILFLDIGPIFLDVLGLQVDLSQIVLDVTAVSGAGNLLGNLLCAVAGLLDGLGFLDELLGTLGDLNNLLGQINDILSGLLG